MIGNGPKMILYLSPPWAWHFCVGSGTRAFFDLALPFYKALFPKGDHGKAMASIVLHHGSKEEIADILRIYGVPKSCLDVSIGGTTTAHDFEGRILCNQNHQQ